MARSYHSRGKLLSSLQRLVCNTIDIDNTVFAKAFDKTKVFEKILISLNSGCKSRVSFMRFCSIDSPELK